MEKIYLFICMIFVFATKGACAGTIFKSLTDHVSSQLQPYVVPQTDPAKPVYVFVQMGVYGVDNVDRHHNQLHIRSWILITWNSTITWDPSQFNNLTSVLLPATDGYVPQVSSLVSAGSEEILAPVETRYMFNGIAVFYVTVRWKLLCDLSKEDTCAIKLFSSDYDNSVIRLRHPRNLPIFIEELTSRLRYEKSDYEIFGDSYSYGNATVKGFTRGYDWIQYQFSFKKRSRDYHNGPMAIFKWN